MDEETSFRKVLEALYDAALDETLWPEAAGKVSVYCGGIASAALIVADREKNESRFLSIVGMDKLDEYFTHILPADPRKDFHHRNPGVRFQYDYRFTSERQMKRSEYYDWLGNNADSRYYLAANVEIDADHSCLILGVRAGRQGHAQAEDVRHLSLLIPHIEQAVRIGVRVGGLAQRGSVAELVLDTIPQGVFLLDARGRVSMANRMAHALIASRDGLVLEDGFLHSESRQGDRTLQSLIGAATICTDPASADAAGGTVKLRRPSGRRPYDVLVAPSPGRNPWGSIEGVVAVVLIADPAHEAILPPGALMRHFGLTRREAALALQLATGRSIDECAEALGMTRNTARAHLQRIYRKTETRRQAELVRLLSSLPALPADPDPDAGCR